MQDLQDSYFNKCEKVQCNHSEHEFGIPTGVNSLSQPLSSCLAQAINFLNLNSLFFYNGSCLLHGVVLKNIFQGLEYSVSP